MPEENTKTTIQISKDTQKGLLDVGRKGETYDEVIQRLLNDKEKRRN